MQRYTSTKISCYIGYIVQAIINNFLPLLFLIFQTKYNVSYEALGRLIFINFVVQISVDIVSVKVVKLLGYRTITVLAHAIAALGLVMLGVLPMLFPENVYTCLVIAILFYATGSGIIEVIISPIVEYLPGEKKAAEMCFLHSFYCWGQMLTVIVSTVLLRVLGGNWMLLPIIWAVIPFVNMFSFMRVPLVIPQNEVENKGDSISVLLKNRKFYKLLIAMLCAGASEIAVAQWSSMFIEQALGVDKVLGDLLGPCAFALFMGTGRIIFGLLGEKISLNRLITINAALCFVCYLVVSFSSSPVLCLISCAACGFSVSLMWPGTYSVAAKEIVSGGTAMYGILAMLGDMGCSLGPWLVGLVADFADLQAGFLVVSVFPAIMFLSGIRDEIKKSIKLKRGAFNETR
ncbi:MAG: MFS transporter [Ruminococcaceae bacterium]|nr:MFS transporter [Oscillospiraceae bacterium]